jgi:hypothetical protein
MDSTQAFCPGFEAWDMIDTDTQNLGIISRELSQTGLVRRDLASSYRRPGHREKCQNNRFSMQIAKADILT